MPATCVAGQWLLEAQQSGTANLEQVADQLAALQSDSTSFS
jgi:hypothetical protein